MSKKNVLLYLSVFFLNIGTYAYTAGTRIMWDYSRLYRVSQGTYPRLERLQNGMIMCVAEDINGIFCLFSNSEGKRWTSQIRIKNDEPNLHMAVPEVTQISNGTIIVTYNGRVKSENGSTRFDIRTIRSSDSGLTWSDEKIVYQAGTSFGTGCWEPAILDKRDGELQIFFANEAPYSANNDQEISVIKSYDNGNSWSFHSTVSYRQGSRDGMPVPVKLSGNKGYTVAIEDLYNNNFSPVLLYSSDGSWSSSISGNSPNRWFASSDNWLYTSYNGAPYLIQMPSGETILSVQSTYNRSTNQHLTDMIVGIGNDNASDFKNYSKPFNIATEKYCLWNSLFVKNDTTITAITASNAFPYSGEDASWIMSKDGYLLNDIVCKNSSPQIDGVIGLGEYSNQRIFLGAYSEQNATIFTANDNVNLYIAVLVKDKKLWQDSDYPLNDDAIRIFIDPQNKNAIRPGVFSIAADLNGNIRVQEGNTSGFWSTKTIAEITLSKKINGTINNNQDVDEGYVVEIAIPWIVLGYTPTLGTGFGINFSLYDDSNGAGNDYQETISGNNELNPISWCKITRTNATNTNDLFLKKNNPEIVAVGNQIRIKANDYKNSTIIIFSIAGNIIYKGFIQSETQINLANKFGIYMIKLNNSNEQYIKKIMLI